MRKRTAQEELGYERAKEYLERGDYLSPMQVFHESSHLYLREFINYSLFEKGVLQALKEHKQNHDETRRKIKENLERAIQASITS